MFTKDTVEIQKDFDSLKNMLGTESSSFSRDDLLNLYYYPSLQNFIDNKIKNVNDFFLRTPGRFLLRYLMDRFCYHTNSNKDISDTYYCCTGTDRFEDLKDGTSVFYLTDSVRYDVNDTDFLKLKEILKDLSQIQEILPSLKKCDSCLYRYFCGLPCSDSLKKAGVSLTYPEDRCYITKELYKWYENHLNSILKAIFKYSKSHSIRFIEDSNYFRIENDRLNSKYFYLDIGLNDLAVRLK